VPQILKGMHSGADPGGALGTEGPALHCWTQFTWQYVEDYNELWSYYSLYGH